MDPNNRKNLSKALRTLYKVVAIFDDPGMIKGTNTSYHSVDRLEEVVRPIEKENPGILPPFEKRNHFAFQHSDGRSYYNVASVRAYLAEGQAAIETELSEAEAPAESAVTEHEEFLFVKEAPVREILVRDFQEVQRGFIARNWKSVLILSGGIIEAILLDALKRVEAQARSSKDAPKGELERWELVDLIKIAADLKLVSSELDGLSNTVRGYRNLVHRGSELRKGTKFGEDEAVIAVRIIKILKRDLS